MTHEIYIRLEGMHLRMMERRGTIVKTYYGDEAWGRFLRLGEQIIGAPTIEAEAEGVNTTARNARMERALALLREGRTNAEVADELGVHPKTVRNYRRDLAGQGHAIRPMRRRDVTEAERTEAVAAYLKADPPHTKQSATCRAIGKRFGVTGETVRRWVRERRTSGDGQASNADALTVAPHQARRLQDKDAERETT